MGNQVGEMGGGEDGCSTIVVHVNLCPFLPKSLALTLQQPCNRIFSRDNLFIDTHIATTIPKEQTSACFYLPRCSQKYKRAKLDSAAVVYVSYICKGNSQMPNAS